MRAENWPPPRCRLNRYRVCHYTNSERGTSRGRIRPADRVFDGPPRSVRTSGNFIAGRTREQIGGRYWNIG
jgi:hypothetical protein